MDAILHIIAYGDGQIFFCEIIKDEEVGTSSVAVDICWVVAHAGKDYVVRSSHDHTILSRLLQYISPPLAVTSPFLVMTGR